MDLVLPKVTSPLCRRRWHSHGLPWDLLSSNGDLVPTPTAGLGHHGGVAYYPCRVLPMPAWGIAQAGVDHLEISTAAIATVSSAPEPHAES
jgi:hypothetical protein